MSSVDSGINSLTATVVYDWLSGRQPGVRGSRIICTLFGIGAVLTALVLNQWQFNVFDMVIAISGAWLGGLLGLFLLGMLSRRANTGGAVVGIIAGVSALAWAMSSEISGWWYSAVSCVPTLAIGWAASFFFEPPAQPKADVGRPMSRGTNT